MKHLVLCTMLAAALSFAGAVRGTPFTRLLMLTSDAQRQRLSPEVFDVLQLPVSIGPASLQQAADGYEWHGSAANRSDEQVLGLRLLLLVVNESGQVRGGAAWSERVEVAGYATEECAFKIPMKLKIKRSDRVVLMIEQVIGRASIWNVVKAEEALKGYVTGEAYASPEVQHVSNLFDGATLPQPRPH